MQKSRPLIMFRAFGKKHSHFCGNILFFYCTQFNFCSMQRERDKKVRGYSIEISAFSKGKTTLDQLITNLLIIMKTTFFLMAIISIRVKPASTELQWRDLNARSCIQSAKNNPKNKQKQPTPKKTVGKKKPTNPHPIQLQESKSKLCRHLTSL